jgi:hypothetical protein
MILFYMFLQESDKIQSIEDNERKLLVLILLSATMFLSNLHLFLPDEFL